MRRLALLVLLLTGVAGVEARVSHADEGLPPVEQIGVAGARNAVQPAIVQLLAAYAQYADARDPERFGALFTEDGIFRVRATPDGDASAVLLRGRDAIVSMLGRQHAALRERGAQRRHLLTNPLVWDASVDQARVAVSLLLVETVDGGLPVLVGAGRYDGRLVRTVAGWRIAEWTLSSDQSLAGAGLDER